MFLSKGWFSLVTPRNIESLTDTGSIRGGENKTRASERWERWSLLGSKTE